MLFIQDTVLYGKHKTLPVLTAQQDITVEWRASLADLDQRLTMLVQDGGPAAESWRNDAEALRISLASFLAVQGGINNLFDRNFFYTAGYPEPGRNWFVNLRYRF